MRYKKAIVLTALLAAVAGIRCEADSDLTTAPGWNGPQPGATVPFSGSGQASGQEGLRGPISDPSDATPGLRPYESPQQPVNTAPPPSYVDGAPAPAKRHKGHTSLAGAALGLPDRTSKVGVGMTDRTAKVGAGLTDRAAKTTVGLPYKAAKEIFKAIF